MTIKRTQSGFTLLETLLYALFLSFILGGALGATYGIIQNSDHMAAQVAAQEDATFIMRKLQWALTGATGVTVPTPETLRVTRSGSPSTVTFDLDGTDIRMKKGSADPVILNGAGSIVTSVSFTQYSVPEGVGAAFAINGQSFTVTKYLRK